MTVLFSVTASAAVLIGFTALLRALCRRRLPAGFFRALWIAAAVRLLVFAEIPSPVSIFALIKRGSTAAGSGTMTGAWHAVIPVSGTASPAPVASLSPLFLLWITGAVLLAASFLLPHLRFCRQLHRAAETEWVGRRILVCPQAAVPCAVGLFRPAVCLPKVPLEYEADTLACILAHENAHIRRGDIPVKWLLAAALCLHWFNPMVWVLYVLACRDLEFACDEAAIRRLGGDTDARVRCAAMLLDQLETRAGGVSTVPSILGNGRISPAKERILRMIQPKKTSLALIILAVLLCVTVTAVFAAVPAGIPTDNMPSLPEEDLVWSPSVPTDTLPLDPAPADPAPADADSVTLIFPLPTDSVWEMTAPFGAVAYLPQMIVQNDPPFYFLSRIPDDNGNEMTVVTLVTNHDGVDFAVAQGTDVLAVADGTVLEVSYDWQRGIYVMIDCGGGVIAEYRHLEKHTVSPGDTVSQGDIIAYTGYTGAATGPHLHFSLIVDGAYVDPMAYYTPD